MTPTDELVRLVVGLSECDKMLCMSVEIPDDVELTAGAWVDMLLNDVGASDESCIDSVEDSYVESDVEIVGAVLDGIDV